MSPVYVPRIYVPMKLQYFITQRKFAPIIAPLLTMHYVFYVTRI